MILRDRIFNAKIFIIVILLFVSCKHRHNRPPEKITTNNETIDEEVKKIIFDQVNQFRDDSLLIIGNDTLLTGAWISDFYKRNNYLPAWTEKNKLTVPADSFLNVLAAIESYGASSKRYRIDNLIERISTIVSKQDSGTSVTRVYEINILLTDIFFRLSVQLKKGIISEKTLLPEWKGREHDTSLVLLLRETLQKNNFRTTIESLEPKFEHYVLLKNYLEKFLQEAKSLSDSSTNKNYSKSLIPNDSLSQRINQVMMNMERWRWEDVTDEDYTININIPSYTLQFYVCGFPVMNSKVITGKPETPTPFILDSKVSYFYVYPYWFVPFSIATKEILPILKRDTGYLTKNNMDILDKNRNVMDATEIHWKKYSEEYFPFTIRQRDGDENTLGVLKFIFPNKYGIYLHDTNSHLLFSKEYRALSHGCIRLEKAKKLAELITEYCVINFNSDSLQDYINKKERRRIDLFRPLPIYIRYYTAVADSAAIHFYDDIYSIDGKMIESFNSDFTNYKPRF